MSLRPSRDYVSQESCDMAKPDEHLLWGLMQIQLGREMMPILENTARAMSKHLYELGFRHHPQLQRKKYQKPLRGGDTHLNPLARWVPMDAEDPEPMPIPDVGSMTNQERAYLLEEMKRHGMVIEPKPEPKTPSAAVADWNGQRTIKRATTTQELGIET